MNIALSTLLSWNSILGVRCFTPSIFCLFRLILVKNQILVWLRGQQQRKIRPRKTFTPSGIPVLSNSTASALRSTKTKLIRNLIKIKIKNCKKFLRLGVIKLINIVACSKTGFNLINAGGLYTLIYTYAYPLIFAVILLTSAFLYTLFW